MSRRLRSTFPSLLLFFFSLAALIPFCFALSFSFSSFQQGEPLDFSNNANVDFQALQVTRNPGTGSSDSVINTSGQITYKKALQLWHKSYSYAASFNTSFLLNMNNISNNINGSMDGDSGGMAFYLSSRPAIPILPNSSGMWLGLYDGSVIDPSQQPAEVVAIEFDTFKDSFDLDGNHVGVDVNGSVESLPGSTVSLSDRDVELLNLSNAGGMNTSVWIDYDGHHHTLDVYLADQGSHVTEKPATPVISGLPIHLRNYLPETVYVGFSTSVGTNLKTHCVLEWNFSSTHDFSEFRQNIVTIVASSAAIALILVLVLVLIFVLRKRRRSRDPDMADLSSVNYGPRRFSYRKLKRATKGFSDECKLGEGGFGTVYKGVLASKRGEPEYLAVKCMSRKSKQGVREFKAEVMSMGRMRHKNLMQLLGWSCSGRKPLMLVYEYLPNGSLDQWIGQGSDQVDKGGGVMGWEGSVESCACRQTHARTHRDAQRRRNCSCSN